MYIGIDLGTSNSAIAGIINSEVKLFKTADGADILPSAVYIDKRGHRFYGARAYNQIALSPENVASKFKRLMGTSTLIECQTANISLAPEECSADILKQLMAQAFTESGTSDISGTVITIPAAFNQMQSEATLRSAQIAGFERVALLQEPIAAAMAAMTQSKNKNGQFLVYDLGGGTFDLALVQSVSGAINILAHEGINMLGGTDFDRLLLNNFVRPWLVENFKLPTDFQKTPKYQKVLRIAQWASEKAKIELSSKETSIIFASDEDIRTQDEDGKDIYFEIEINRTDLEELISGEIDKTIELSKKILKDNGYSHEDIDRIVFIGGPTKMPIVRNRVPHELGIPSDLQTDPMTAVAIGAAIYCESRDWSNSAATARKISRGSSTVNNEIDIKYDYPTRTSDEKARLRIKVGSESTNKGYQLQVDNNLGWTSGRKSISEDCILDLPLTEVGENAFRIILFDSSGKPIADGSTQFSIMRTYASSVGIPATQTISIKVREGLDSQLNILESLVVKGTMLPAKGIKKFRAARDLESEDTDHLNFELYQDEGAKEAELNLCVGAFRISGGDLTDGVKIKSGDELIFHWEMTDSGLIRATIEVPSIGQTFETKNYYTPQSGHQNYDLANGFKIASAVIEDAEKELERIKESLASDEANSIPKLEEQIQKQKEVLRDASEPDVTRAVTESVRRIRQSASHIKHLPENQSKVVVQELSRQEELFNTYCRESADAKVQARFDLHLEKAKENIKNGDIKSIKEAAVHINELSSICWSQFWLDPEFLFAKFKRISEQGYLATDKKLFEKLLRDGIQAIEGNDTNLLRRIIFELMDTMVSLGTAEESVTELASIMRS